MSEVESVKLKEKEIFEKLSSVNLEGDTKQKVQLDYLPWAKAWEIVKRIYPNTTFEVERQVIDDRGTERFWFDDGRTGWVVVRVYVDGVESECILPIMNSKNRSIPAEEITSFDANKAVMRCLVKALAYQGLGLYIYQGEDLPTDEKRIRQLKTDIREALKKKFAISKTVENKCIALCKEAEQKAFPELKENELTGNYLTIDDQDILEDLYKRIIAVR